MSTKQAIRRLAAALAAAALPAWAADTPPPAAALDRPALQSPKSPRMAILTVAQAGKRMVAAGERGIVIYSDDGGRSWKQAQTPTSASLTAMRFADAQSGWAVGHMGLVLHTADGGLTWDKQLDGAQAAKFALAAAQKGGDARALQDAERLMADGADKPFFDICVLDERTLFIVGAYNLTFRSDDGGRSWMPWQAHVVNPKALHLYAIHAVGDTLFIAGEQGLLLRSDDRGQHFAPIESPYKGSWFGLVGGGSGSLLAYGLRGNAYVTTDLGKHWQQAASGTPVSISAGAELADGRIVLVSQAGQVLVSSDLGFNFTHLPQKTGLPLAAVAQGPDGLIVGSLRGVLSLPLPAK
jgi:photosystem II stability/assembly factor-like uncharacterized protein